MLQLLLMIVLSTVPLFSLRTGGCIGPMATMQRQSLLPRASLYKEELLQDVVPLGYTLQCIMNLLVSLAFAAQ